MNRFVKRLAIKFDNIACVFSPDPFHQIDIFVEDKSSELPSELDMLSADESLMLYLTDVISPSLLSTQICGIEGISETFFLKDEDTDEWFCETNANISKNNNTFSELLSLDNVDFTRTISNNAWDIYEVLDIEATRQFLIDEFKSIMDDINECHISILVDRMTYSGTVSSITRYTLKHEDSGPFGKASFEETMDHFMNAAVQCDIEPTNGVSASIICGKQISSGTGMSSVSLDIDALTNISTI